MLPLSSDQNNLKTPTALNNTYRNSKDVRKLTQAFYTVFQNQVEAIEPFFPEIPKIHPVLARSSGQQNQLGGHIAHMPGHLDIKAIRTFKLKQLKWNNIFLPVFDILFS